MRCTPFLNGTSECFINHPMHFSTLCEKVLKVVGYRKMLDLKDTLIIILQNLAHEKEGKTKSGISLFFPCFSYAKFSEIKMYGI